MTFVSRADELLAVVRAELGRPMSERGSRASDEQLRFVQRRVQQMKGEVSGGVLPPSETRHPVLTRMVVDSWDLGADVSRGLMALEKEYRNL